MTSRSFAMSGQTPHRAQRALIQAAVICAPIRMAGDGGNQPSAPRAANSHSRIVRQASAPARIPSFMSLAPRPDRPMRRRTKAVVAQGADRVMREGLEHADFLGLVDFQDTLPFRPRVSTRARRATALTGLTRKSAETG